jgi:hypothetical protein
MPFEMSDEFRLFFGTYRDQRLFTRHGQRFGHTHCRLHWLAGTQYTNRSPR